MTPASCPVRGIASESVQSPRTDEPRRAVRRGPPRFVVFGLGIGLGILVTRKLTVANADT